MDEGKSDTVYDHFFVARQPIFYDNGKIWGYELLFRADPNLNQAIIRDEDLATFTVATCGFIRSQEDQDQTKKMCINFTEKALFDGAPRGLPPAVTVIEVLENIVPSERLFEVLIGYKQEGYLIAVDDFVGNRDLADLLNLADIIKVDLLHKSIDEIREICAVIGNNKAIKLAEKVDHREIIPELQALGFNLFQGYFFAKPEILSGRKISTTQISKLRILQAVEDPNATTDSIEKVVLADPSITYRLLRFLNTAAFGFSKKIESIRHAIVLLGLNRLRNWLRMVILSDLLGKKTPELYSMALNRGRLLEELANEGQIKAKTADTMFLFGLLSLIEPMLEMPLEAILKDLPLSEDLKAGYLEKDSIYFHYLKLLKALEYADVIEITDLCRELTIMEDALADASVRSVAWANQMTSFMI